MRAKHLIPLGPEDLKLDMERAVKGEAYKDRETALIFSMRAHGMGWKDIIELPYRIYLKMNMLRHTEQLVRGA